MHICFLRALSFVKMRPAKYVKIITSQLEQFDDMKKQLENLLEDIKHIINQGQSWIDETVNTLSFTQINQLLTSETSNCIQKCLNITLEDDPMATTKVNIPCSSSKIFSPHSSGDRKSDGDFNQVKIKIDEFDKRISEQSTKLKNLNQKVKRQEKQNETSIQLTEKEKNTEVQLAEILKELHAASDFMSNLQSKTEMLTNKQNENEKKLNGVIEKLTDQDERIKLLTTNQTFVSKKLQDEVEEILPTKVMNLKGDIDNVKSDLDSFKSSSDLNLRYFTDKNDEKFTKMSSEFNELSTYFTEMKLLNSKKSVSFSVGLTALTVVKEGCVVKYNEIFTNIPDSYNVSTGIFTCPVNGHYVFHINLTTDSDDFVNLALFQNNYNKISVYAHNPDCVSSGGNSVILHLKLNDQVFLKAQCISVLSGDVSDITSTFSGFLLAAD
ncbi:EMILIN-2 [Bulinus truncatus]|nr:EMILIN-2 [Bulinus truncatus]